MTPSGFKSLLTDTQIQLTKKSRLIVFSHSDEFSPAALAVLLVLQQQQQQQLQQLQQQHEPCLMRVSKNHVDHSSLHAICCKAYSRTPASSADRVACQKLRTLPRVCVAFS